MTSSVRTRFTGWMRQDALPVWADAGHDGPGRGFVEQMTLDGVPADVPFKRMRVQARQIYVFSHAAVLGWPGGATAAEDAMAFITRHGRRGDGGWVRRMGRDGGVLDPAADLYEIAFVLLALCWYGRASGDTVSFRQARQTLDWVRTHMPAAPGYANAHPPEPGPRQQNPHMHLLEAVLALFEATGDEAYAQEALHLLALFRGRFFHPETGTLGEFFDDELLAPDDHVEPGHLFEWVWLLVECERLLGTATETAGLYAAARRYAGPIPDVVSRGGAVLRASSRLWPHTEAVRTHLVMGEGAAADAVLGHVMERHLTSCPRGMWREHFGADGALISDRIPATSLYHLFTAFAAVGGSGLGGG